MLTPIDGRPVLRPMQEEGKKENANYDCDEVGPVKILEALSRLGMWLRMQHAWGRRWCVYEYSNPSDAITKFYNKLYNNCSVANSVR